MTVVVFGGFMVGNFSQRSKQHNENLCVDVLDRTGRNICLCPRKYFSNHVYYKCDQVENLLKSSGMFTILNIFLSGIAFSGFALGILGCCCPPKEENEVTVRIQPTVLAANPPPTYEMILESSSSTTVPQYHQGRFASATTELSAIQSTPGYGNFAGHESMANKTIPLLSPPALTQKIPKISV